MNLTSSPQFSGTLFVPSGSADRKVWHDTTIQALENKKGLYRHYTYAAGSDAQSSTPAFTVFSVPDHMKQDVLTLAAGTQPLWEDYTLQGSHDPIGSIFNETALTTFRNRAPHEITPTPTPQSKKEILGRLNHRLNEIRDYVEKHAGQLPPGWTYQSARTKADAIDTLTRREPIKIKGIKLPWTLIAEQIERASYYNAFPPTIPISMTYFNRELSPQSVKLLVDSRDKYAPALQEFSKKLSLTLQTQEDKLLQQRIIQDLRTVPLDQPKTYTAKLATQTFQATGKQFEPNTFAIEGKFAACLEVRPTSHYLVILDSQGELQDAFQLTSGQYEKMDPDKVDKVKKSMLLFFKNALKAS